MLKSIYMLEREGVHNLRKYLSLEEVLVFHEGSIIESPPGKWGRLHRLLSRLQPLQWQTNMLHLYLYTKVVLISVYYQRRQHMCSPNILLCFVVKMSPPVH